MKNEVYLGIFIVIILFILSLVAILMLTSPPECGNGICVIEEDSNSCPEDCPSCDDYNVCTTDSYDYDSQVCINAPLSPCCGNDVCEEGESPEDCPKDCSECNDNDPCTNDVFDYPTQQCQNIEIVPCCGNRVCEEGESFPECEDCEYSILPSSAVHAIIVSGSEVVATRDVLEKISSKESSYSNAFTYDEIPIDHSSNPFGHTVNSHDYVNITFDIPSVVLRSLNERELFMEVYLACGDYGEIFIESENKFGEMDTLSRIKCQEKWEEFREQIALESPPDNLQLIRLRKDGGVGKVKVDFVRMYAS